MTAFVFLAKFDISKNDKIFKNISKKYYFCSSDNFNVSISTGIFPSVLKIAKAVPIYKKLSKLDYSNYCPISLLSNLKKYFLINAPLSSKDKFIETVEGHLVNGVIFFRLN